MKNVSFIFAFLFLTVFTVSANNVNPKPVKATAALRTEIINLLGDNCPYDYTENECTAQVLFTVNLKGELIVISVDSPNKLAEKYIKGKLNYKSVQFRPGKEGSIYLLPLRMKKTN